MCYVFLMSKKQHCTASTRTGRPCRAWAVRDSDPPRCIAHTGNRNFFGELLHNIAADPYFDHIPAEPQLDREITTTRLILNRLLEQLQAEPALTPHELATLAPLIFQGAQTVARLLRAQRAIGGEAAGGITGAVAQALDELATQWQAES